MEIDWFPLSFFGSVFFWIIFLVLGLLMPFFVFINTITLGKILRELQKTNSYISMVEKNREQQTLGQYPRPND